MPENSEQQNFNPEQELDPSEQATLELRTPKQELALQGQQLAVQIKDMHEKAQTKEDFSALQEKIAELREMFEVKPPKGEYRDVGEILYELSAAVNNISWEENFTWELRQPDIKSNRDLGDILVSINMFTKANLKKLHYEEFPETRYDGMNTASILRMGMYDLEYELQDRKGRLLFDKEKMRLGIEIKPEPFKDVGTVIKEITDKLDYAPTMQIWSCQLVTFKDSPRLFIDMGTDLSNEENITQSDFNMYPPKALFNYINNPEIDAELVNLQDINILKIHDKINERSVRSYLVNGNWFLEVEPPKEKEPVPLETLVLDVMGKVPFDDGETPESITWGLFGNRKYILMATRIPEKFEDTEGLFNQLPYEEGIKVIQASEDAVEGVGLPELIQVLKNDDAKALSFRYNDKWLIKLVD